jgi:hypothetical protein
MIYYKRGRQREYCGHCTPIYKHLRIANFMILKDSIVAYRSIKIHKLTKLYVH